MTNRRSFFKTLAVGPSVLVAKTVGTAHKPTPTDAVLTYCDQHPDHRVLQVVSDDQYLSYSFMLQSNMRRNLLITSPGCLFSGSNFDRIFIGLTVHDEIWNSAPLGHRWTTLHNWIDTALKTRLNPGGKIQILGK